MKLYEIINSINDAVYVGITRTTLSARYRAHKHSAKRGTVTPLYSLIRKYGFENFRIILISEFQHEIDLLAAEKSLIQEYRNSGTRCLNILDGGESYFPVKDWEAHKAKLKAARAGRKPALGMKHTDENKKIFSQCSKQRWDIYGRYPSDVILLSFKDAKIQYGISKTHYYRLKQLAKPNELS